MTGKKSFVISDQNILDWLAQHTEDNSRTNGISATTRQLISLGILLYERGFRIDEMGQLLKKINHEELANFMMTISHQTIDNKLADNNIQGDISKKFHKFAHL